MDETIIQMRQYMHRSYVFPQIVLGFRITVTVFADIQPTMNQHIICLFKDPGVFTLMSQTVQYSKVFLLCVSVCDEQDCSIYLIYIHKNCKNKVSPRCVSVCDQQDCSIDLIYNHTNCKNKVSLRCASVCD